MSLSSGPTWRKGHRAPEQRARRGQNGQGSTSIRWWHSRRNALDRLMCAGKGEPAFRADLGWRGSPGAHGQGLASGGSQGLSMQQKHLTETWGRWLQKTGPEGAPVSKTECREPSASHEGSQPAGRVLHQREFLSYSWEVPTVRSLLHLLHESHFLRTSSSTKPLPNVASPNVSHWGLGLSGIANSTDA